MEDILARLKLNDARKPSNDVRSLDKLLHNLQDQNKALKRQEAEIKNGANSDRHLSVSMSASGDSSSNSDAGVSTAVPFDNGSTGLPTAPCPTPAIVKTDNAEILRVKQELEAAKSVISRQEQELAETRTLKHTMDQAMGPPSEIGDFVPPKDLNENTIGHLQSAFNAAARPFTSPNDGWMAQDNLQVDPTDLAGGNFGRSRGIWQNTSAAMADIQATNPSAGYTNTRDPRIPGHGYNNLYGAPTSGESGFQNGNFSENGAALGYDMRSQNDTMGFNSQQLNMRRNGAPLRINTTALDPLAPYQSYPPGATALTPPAITSMGIPSQYNYSQRGVAAPLSPTGTDFNSSSGQIVVNPWPLSVSVMGRTSLLQN